LLRRAADKLLKATAAAQLRNNASHPHHITIVTLAHSLTTAAAHPLPAAGAAHRHAAPAEAEVYQEIRSTKISKSASEGVDDVASAAAVSSCPASPPATPLIE